MWQTGGLPVEKIVDVVVMDYLFIKYVGSRLGGAHHPDAFGEIPSFPALQCCNYFLGHVVLFYLTVNRDLL